MGNGLTAGRLGRAWVGAASSYWPVHGVLAGAQVRHRVLHRRVREVGVLLGLEPQAGQAGVAGVSVHVGAGRGGVGAGGRRHRYRVERRGAIEVVEVAQVVEAAGGNSGHRRGHHARGHVHGGDGAGGGEHGLG